MKMAQTSKSRRIVNKIVLGMMWLVIVMSILASILLFSEFINNQRINAIERLYVFLGIIMILTFVFFLFVLSTKYRKEMVLNDTEKDEKWITLRKDYRKFFMKMLAFQVIFGFFMLSFGLYSSFNPHPGGDRLTGILVIVVGINMIFSAFQHKKKLNKLEKK